MLMSVTSSCLPTLSTKNFAYITLDWQTKNMYLNCRYNEKLFRQSRIDTTIGEKFVFEETKYVNPQTVLNDFQLVQYQSLVHQMESALTKNNIELVGKILEVIKFFHKEPNEYSYMYNDKLLNGALGGVLTTYGYLFLYK